MHILVVTQYFPPEVGAPQTRLGDLTRLWAEAGNEVTVLTGFPNYPNGVVPPGYRRKLRMRERMDGCDVVRTWLYPTPNTGVVRRAISQLSFTLSSILLGLRGIGKPDVVLVSSPTFLSILSGRIIARVKRAPLVVEVRDLWPAAIADSGALSRGSFALRILERVELASYRAAALVVTASQGFADDIAARGIDSSKLRVVTNGVDIERFSYAGGLGPTREWLGAGESDQLVLYAGNFGLLYSLDVLVHAAHALRGEPIRFALVGEGATKDSVAKLATSMQLDNIRLLPSVPLADLPRIMAAADICVLPLSKLPSAKMAIAAKAFEYMAVAKPIVAGAQGETARILREAEAIVLTPEDVGALVSALRELAGDPERRVRMGQKGLETVRTNYDRAILAKTYRDLLGETTVSNLSPS